MSFDEALARAREAHDRPPSLDQLTMSEQELDEDLEDHVRTTPWVDEPPEESQWRDWGEELGRKLLRVRSCRARRKRDSKLVTLIIYEYGAVSRRTQEGEA